MVISYSGPSGNIEFLQKAEYAAYVGARVRWSLLNFLLILMNRLNESESAVIYNHAASF